MFAPYLTPESDTYLGWDPCKYLLYEAGFEVGRVRVNSVQVASADKAF